MVHVVELMADASANTNAKRIREGKKTMTELAERRIVTFAALAAVLALAVTARAVDVPSEWQSMDAAGLAQLAKDLKAQGEAKKADRQLLAEYVAGRYLTSGDATRAVSYGHWVDFGESLGPDMPTTTREQWRTGIRSAFSAKDMAWAEVNGIQHVLWQLGEQHANEFVAAWTGSYQSWKSWSADEFVNLGGMLGWGYDCEPAVAAARARVAQEITARFLAGAASIEAVGCERWSKLAKCFKGALSDQTRATWVSSLRSTFAGDQQKLTALRAADLGHLVDAIRYLNAEGQAVEVSQSWLAAHDTEQMYQQGDMAWADQLKIADACVLAGDKPKAQEWAIRAYQTALGSEEARTAADKVTLKAITDLMERTGLSDEGGTNMGFALALARLIREGNLQIDARDDLSPDWRALSEPVCNSQARQVIEQELTDAEGRPRLAAAKIMAWIEYTRGQQHLWLDRLEQRISGETDPDKRALWMLAKAYHKSVVGVRDARKTTSRVAFARHWQDQLVSQALGTATSPQVRLEAVGEIMRHYIRIERPGLGARMLESVKGQFAGQQLAQIETWVVRNQMACAARLEMEAAKRTAREAKRKEKLLAYYRQRLVLAEAGGDEGKCQRLQAAIERLGG